MKIGKIIIVAALAMMLAFVYTAVPGTPDVPGEDDAVLSAPAVPTAAYTFTITQSGATFSATGTPGAITIPAGTIQSVIDAIDLGRESAVKKITFSGTPLDLGTARVGLSNGTYIVDGNVTSAGGITIMVSGNATLFVVGGSIKNTNSSGDSIRHASSGALNISGGEVSATGNSGSAVNLRAGALNISGAALLTSVCADLIYGTLFLETAGTGTVTMEGGTVRNTSTNSDSNAICNRSAGAVNISGGEVSATSGNAIYSTSTGPITVSGTATVRSATTAFDRAAVYLTGTSAEVRLAVDGGTIEATASSGNAIYTAGGSSGSINITGGNIKVSANNSYAVWNRGDTRINMSGGTISATGGGYGLVNQSASAVNITGGTINTAGGVAIYIRGAGPVTISEANSATPTVVTSVNATSTLGTICLTDEVTTIDMCLTITGGKVTNTSTSPNANTIYNGSVGSVRVYGGEVSATGGNAIRSNSESNIVINNTALVKSASTNVGCGTIYLEGSFTGVRLAVDGGTIEATGNYGNAILCAAGSTGLVNITGGTVKATATNAYGIYNRGTGSVNVYGGTVSSTSSTAIDSTGNVTVSGGEVSGSNYAIYKNGTNTVTVTVSGGTVSSTSGSTTIYSASNGNVTVSGGTVSATGAGTAISHGSGAGTVTVSGGTVSAAAGAAIFVGGTGNVTVSGGTVSATALGGAAINIYSTGTVNISGGEVSALNVRTIYNYTTGTVNISGGEVSATTGRAVYNGSTGTVNISGGTVSATTGNAVYNNSTGTVNISEAVSTEPTLVTSANESATSGTIHLANLGGTLNISKGTANNTATTGPKNVVYPTPTASGPDVHITLAPTKLAKIPDVSKSYDGNAVTLWATFSNVIIFDSANWEKDGEFVTGATSMTLDVKEIEDSGVYVLKVKYWADGAWDVISSDPINVNIKEASAGLPIMLIVGIAAAVVVVGAVAFFLIRKR